MPLIDHTEGYLDEVRAFANKINLKDQLEKQLKYLDEYANGPGGLGPSRCNLYRDLAPLSLYFVMEAKRNGEWERWFNGGLIFHGPHDGGGDGGAPTYCVSLNPCTGWQIHT